MCFILYFFNHVQLTTLNFSLISTTAIVFVCIVLVFVLVSGVIWSFFPFMIMPRLSVHVLLPTVFISTPSLMIIHIVIASFIPPMFNASCHCFSSFNLLQLSNNCITSRFDPVPFVSLEWECLHVRIHSSIPREDSLQHIQY